MAEAAAKREAGAATAADRPWLFQKGQSGNPAGRPKGAKNQSTLLADALLAENAVEVIRLLLERAKQGDNAILRFLGSRLFAPARHRRIDVDAPEPGAGPVQDEAAAGRAVLSATLAGELAPAEARLLFEFIRQQRAVEEAALEEESRAAPFSATPAAPARKEAPAALPVRPAPAPCFAAPPRHGGRREALLAGTSLGGGSVNPTVLADPRPPRGRLAAAA
jgi:Family of unknown function (DUF5681)